MFFWLVNHNWEWRHLPVSFFFFLFFFGCDICIWIAGCVLNYSQQLVTSEQVSSWSVLVPGNMAFVVIKTCHRCWTKLSGCLMQTSCLLQTLFGNQAVNMLQIAALKLHCSFISAVLSHNTLLLQHWQTENWSLGIQFSRPDHKLVHIISREHS